MNYTFEIQGTAVEPYWVEFSYTKNTFKARCDCPAGEKKQLCKHITSILEGEIPKGLVNGDTSKIPNIVKSFHESNVLEAYDVYLNLFAEIEELKKELTNRKKQVARMLYQ